MGGEAVGKKEKEIGGGRARERWGVLLALSWQGRRRARGRKVRERRGAKLAPGLVEWRQMLGQQ